MATGEAQVSGTGRDPERPAPGGLAAVALGCLLAGVALARWTLSDEPGPPPDPEPPVDGTAMAPAGGPAPPADDASEARPPSPAVARAPAASDPGGDARPPPGAPPDLEGATAAEALPADPATSAPPSRGAVPRPLPAPAEPPPFPEGPERVQVVPGRMAYLRCDGAEIPGRSYPCPRDEPLERAVWDRIERLPRCAELPAVPGEVDLRLVFRGAEPSDLTFRSSEGLDRAAIRRCLAELEAGLNTTIPAERTIAAFRFELIPQASETGD